MHVTGQPPDLANAELVDWQTTDGNGRIRLKIGEGAVVELQTVVMGVLRVGNDPVTGLPAYSIQTQQLVRLVSADGKLRRTPLHPPGRNQGSATRGIA